MVTHLTRARRALILPAAVVGVLAAALLAAGPAHAGTGCNLRFYYNYDGSPAWPGSQVSPYLSCSLPPAIVRYNGGTTVAATDATAGGFETFVNTDGSPNWWKNDGWGGSGPGTVWGGVAITHSYGGIQIAAPGPGGSIMFFWAADGTSTWHPEQVAGPGTMQGAPAMVAGNYTMEIAVTATDGSLRYYWSYDGTPTWYGAQIAPPDAASTSPTMTRFNGGTEIAVAGP